MSVRFLLIWLALAIPPDCAGGGGGGGDGGGLFPPLLSLLLAPLFIPSSCGG